MGAEYKEILVSQYLLNIETSSYFVFGDNPTGQGNVASAYLRNHPKAIGFVTQKGEDFAAGFSFKPEEYTKIFFDQLRQLANIVRSNPKNKYYISKLGFGSVNRYNIWELVVKHNLEEELGEYDNVVFCWNKEI